MAITFPTPPDAAQRIATAGFQQVAQLAESAGSVNLMMLSARGVEISAPHQMHHVRLDDLSARRPFGGATLTGWRYLAMTDSGAVASSEVSADANRQPAGLEQVNMGPYVQSTAAAFADLGENTEVQAGAYEPHLLKIPALCAVVMLLRQLDGDNDLYVPLEPAPDYLEAGRIYREAELLDVLQEPARELLEDDSTFGPQEGA
ncbi:hypothetical protein [Streptomyces albogriseolus]